MLPALAICILGWACLAYMSHQFFVSKIKDDLAKELELSVAVAVTRVETLTQSLKAIAANSITVAAVAGEDIERTARPYLDSINQAGPKDGQLHLLDYKGRLIVSASGHPWVAPAGWGDTFAMTASGQIAYQASGDLLYVALPVRLDSGVEGALVSSMETDSALSFGGEAAVQLSLRAVSKGHYHPDVVKFRTEEDTLIAILDAHVARMPGIVILAKAATDRPVFLDNPVQPVLGGALIAILAVTAFGVLATAAALSAPIARLVEDLSRHGLDIKAAPTDAPREVAVLTRHFMDAARDVEAALIREREVSQRQREFVSMVSHEFRTPLAIIDGAAQGLQRRLSRMTEEKRGERLTMIRNSVVRLVRLMESILVSQRIDAGGLKLEFKPVDFRALVAQIAKERQSISDGATITIDTDALPEQAEADVRLMTSVVDNLLSNAVKYGGDTPQIQVRGWQEGARLHVAVSDSGIGIPNEQLERIGERYFRASTSTGIAGTGVGLNMVKQVIEKHGGAMVVESTLGKGSTFGFHIPLSQSTVAAPDLAEHSLCRVIYTSEDNGSMDEEMLQTVMRDSDKRNAKNGISGCLFHFRGTKLAQVLEGKRQSIDRLMAAISRDSRHKNVTIVVREDIECRAYHDWRMVLVPCQTDDLVATAQKDIARRLTVSPTPAMPSEHHAEVTPVTRKPAA